MPERLDGLNFEVLEAVQFDGVNEPPVSPVDSARIYYNRVSDTLKVSLNGDPYIDLGGISQADADLRYLMLDCSNDPLTSDELDFQHNNYGIVLAHGWAELSHSIGFRAGAKYLRLNDSGQLLGTGVNQLDVNDNAFEFVISDGRGSAFKLDKWTGATYDEVFTVDTVDNIVYFGMPLNLRSYNLTTTGSLNARDIKRFQLFTYFV